MLSKNEWRASEFWNNFTWPSIPGIQENLKNGQKIFEEIIIENFLKFIDILIADRKTDKFQI